MSIRMGVCRIGVSILAVLFAGGLFSANSQNQERSGWPVGGSDIHNTRSTGCESGITPAAAKRLGVKWEYITQGDVSATPTVQDGVVYVVDWGGWLHAVNASYGSAIWSRKISDYTGNPRSMSRTSPAIYKNLVIIGDQGDLNDQNLFPSFLPGRTASVMAIDKNTGELVWRSFVSDHLFSAVTSSPVVYNNRVYVGVCALEEAGGFLPGYVYSARGKVVTLDARSGSLVWEWYTVPKGYTGGAVWGSTPVVDTKRNSIYVSTGNNYTVPAEVEALIAADPAHGESYLAEDDYIDAVIALDLRTGKLKWGKRLQGADTWNVVRGFTPAQFDPAQGSDYDFGSGPNLFTVTKNRRSRDLLGAGQKSGKYWALNPDNGEVVWVQQVGPGGVTGGIQWGSATDGERIYCAVSNSDSKPYTVLNTGETKNNGLWAALDAATGAYLWQTPDPLDKKGFGMVTIADKVMFAGSTSGYMYAFNASNGKILWSFYSGASVVCGPAVVDDVVYWGTGYSRFSGAFGTGGINKLFAFSVR